MIRYSFYKFKNIRKFSNISSNTSYFFDENKSLIYYNPLNECESNHHNSNINNNCINIQKEEIKDICKIKIQLDKLIKHNQSIIKQIRDHEQKIKT